MTKEKKFKDIASEDKAKLVAEWLDEKQGTDVRILDVHELSSICETVVIVTARGVRHAQALADFVNDKVAEENIEMLGMEGYTSAEWILQDLNDVIVHIFQEDNRKFYNLEGLWAEGKSIDVRPEPQEDAQEDAE